MNRKPAYAVLHCLKRNQLKIERTPCSSPAIQNTDTKLVSPFSRERILYFRREFMRCLEGKAERDVGVARGFPLSPDFPLGVPGRALPTLVGQSLILISGAAEAGIATHAII